MRKLLILSLLAGMFLQPVFSTKLVEVKIVDRDYLMVYFKDGEVIYNDTGEGPGAYLGHDLYDEADSLYAYGEELDTETAVLPASWMICSVTDPDYGESGLHPRRISRKSKVNNTDQHWNYKLDHWIFLQLPHSLKENVEYVLEIDPATGSDKSQEKFVFNIENSVSEAIHVNIIGYSDSYQQHAADVYLWLGDGGQRDYSSFEGNKIWLYNIESGEKTEAGSLSFWKKSAVEAGNRNLTGSDVWSADFTESEPGNYRLLVEGIGCSRDFEIKNNIYFEPYKTSLRGYFYMRIGEDGEGLDPIPRKPLFIPGENPEGFTIYLTDLHPFHPAWKEWKGDTWDEPHFKPATESMFWRHRLPGNPVNLIAKGGHSDALDWDRHIAHVSNIYDLLFPFILSNGELKDDHLEIAESGNGIPDIIDEARNEVDLWLSVRDGEAYCHGLTNPDQGKTIMFQAGATTMAAWANAANCAMLAECFRISGHRELEEKYTGEAIKAYRFAEKQNDKQLDDLQDIGDMAMRGRDFKMMAAAFLYNISGDREWEDIIASESLAKNGLAEIETRREGVQTWATAAYLLSDRDINYPGLYENMKASVINQAMEKHVKQMDIRPSRRASTNRSWRTPQNLHLVILAHKISGIQEERDLFLKAMVLEADWGLGRNPSNIVEMTGLGENCIVNCYTTGRNDGSPGLHPGHTPYNNLNPWGGNHNGSNPLWFAEKGYPAWEDGWPDQESHFNCRYSWANAEFTPRQTMRGKMLLYAYLYYLL